MFGLNIKHSIRCHYPDPTSPSHYRTTRSLVFDSLDKAPTDTPYYSIDQSYEDLNNPSFSLFIFGIEHAYPGYSLVNRNYSSYIFNCITAGKGTFNGKPFQRGACFYTLAGETHTMIADQEEPWESVWFSVSAPMGKKFAELLDQQSTDHMFQLSHIDELLRLFTFLIYDTKRVQNSAKFLSGALEMIFSYLKYDSSSQDKENIRISQRQKELIQRAVDYIATNLSTVTVTDLAENVHLEIKYFSKLFTQVTGISPKQYILQAKMDLASYYLSSTDYSMENITTLLGYNHRNSLTTTFKRLYHISPTEYRAIHKNGL